MFTKRATSELGFTLIELLVVILIIGILAAIALPVFLGEQSQGQDASAKSDARNLVSHIESCFSGQENATYSTCTSGSELAGAGLAIGAQAGEVTVTDASASTYTVVSHSKSNTAYTVVRNGGITHDCSPRGQAGCPDDGAW